MSITITYKGKTQTVKQWSKELGINVGTIYGRLNLCWPPELVLSNKRFHFCGDFKAANRLEEYRSYPISSHMSINKDKLCCNKDTKCVNAIPLTPWKDIEDNPSKGTYYCALKEKFIVGDNPIC